MNLYALSPQLSLKIRPFSKKFRLACSTSQPPASPRSLIVIGDGTPDDWVLCVVCHHLDGQETAAVAKPGEKTGTSTFSLMSVYLSQAPALDRMLFLLDQEQATPGEIAGQLEKQLKKLRADYAQLSTEENERLKVYQCTFGQKAFELVLVINGLSEVKTKHHVIEDHLVEVGIELGLVKVSGDTCDPKRLWRGMSGDDREKILDMLVSSRRLAEAAFPQQFKGCARLKATG